MSVNSKMTAIADGLRTMTNTTETMGLDAMATHVNNANTEITEQDAMIEELLTVLEGKSVSPEYETCTVTLNSSCTSAGQVIYYTLTDGIPVINSSYLPALSAVSSILPNGIEVIKGSEIIFGCGCTTSMSIDCSVTGGVVQLETQQLAFVAGARFKVDGAGSVTINY